MNKTVKRVKRESLSDIDRQNLDLGQRYKVILPEVGSDPMYTSDFNTAVGLAQEFGDKAEIIDMEERALEADPPPPPSPEVPDAGGEEPNPMVGESVELQPFDDMDWQTYAGAYQLPSGSEPMHGELGDWDVVVSGSEGDSDVVEVRAYNMEGEEKFLFSGDEASAIAFAKNLASIKEDGSYDVIGATDPTVTGSESGMSPYSEASGFDSAFVASGTTNARAEDLMGMSFDELVTDYGDEPKALAAQYYDAVLAGKSVTAAGGDVTYKHAGDHVAPITASFSDGSEEKLSLEAFAVDMYIAAADTGAQIEESGDDGADAVVRKIAAAVKRMGIQAGYSTIDAVFTGGSGPGIQEFVGELEAQGFDSAGGWAENAEFFQNKLGVSEEEYQQLVDASLDESKMDLVSAAKEHLGPDIDMNTGVGPDGKTTTVKFDAKNVTLDRIRQFANKAKGMGYEVSTSPGQVKLVKEKTMKKSRIKESVALSLVGKKVGGKVIRAVRENDDMDDEQFYVAVDTGHDAEIKVDGDQMFIGPFASPEEAQAAVGSDDAAVVDCDGNLVGDQGDGEEHGSDDTPTDDEMAELIPMESKMKKPNLKKIIEAVQADLRRESGDESLEIDTTIANGSAVTDGGSGELDHKGVDDGKTNQSPQDAGGSTPVKHDDKPDHMPDEPGATLSDPARGAAEMGEDPDLSGAGDGKGGAKIAESFVAKRGNLVQIFDQNSRRRIDSGLVEAVDAKTVTLEGGVSYDLAGHSVRVVY